VRCQAGKPPLRVARGDGHAIMQGPAICRRDFEDLPTRRRDRKSISGRVPANREDAWVTCAQSNDVEACASVKCRCPELDAPIC